jgi:hypothetical protein
MSDAGSYLTARVRARIVGDERVLGLARDLISELEGK